MELYQRMRQALKTGFCDLQMRKQIDYWILEIIALSIQLEELKRRNSDLVDQLNELASISEDYRDPPF